MPTGTVKWFNATKGYGFIAPDDGSNDVFVHVSALERAGLATLREGQRVDFAARPGRDGRLSATSRHDRQLFQYLRSRGEVEEVEDQIEA